MVFGPSASGKGTLLKDVYKNKKHKIRKVLSLPEKISYSKKSLITGPKRDSNEVRSDIQYLLKKRDVVLSKVQWNEIRSRNVPEELQNEVDNLSQIVILLYGDRKNIESHYKERGESWDYDNNFKSEFRIMFKKVRELEDNCGFKVIFFNIGSSELITKENIEEIMENWS